mgnify:CR=1 FL=1
MIVLVPSPKRREGYTLMETLIAMGLLVVLGGGLVTLLSQSVSVWRTAERRGRLYEQGRALLDLVSADLRSTVVRVAGATDATWMRFLCDEDPESGFQRLRFVRSTSGELSDPILRHGGERVSSHAPFHYRGRRVSVEAEHNGLLAPGGIMEVFYTIDPRPGVHYVWRGVRAPVGGAGSLFVDSNVVSSDDEGRASGDAAGTPLADDRPFYLERFAVPVAERVLFFGFRFWTPTTTTWDSVPPLRNRSKGDESGPSLLWDSTRALIGEGEAFGGDDTYWKRRPGSLEEAWDDVFPRFVEVTIVLLRDDFELGPRLAADIGSSDHTLTLTAPIELSEDPLERLIFVDREWMGIESVSGRQLEVYNRGVRGTEARSHERGAQVRIGVVFRRVVAIPSFREREDWDSWQVGGRR